MITKNQKELLDFLGPSTLSKPLMVSLASTGRSIHTMILKYPAQEQNHPLLQFLYGIFRMGQIFPPKL